VKPRQVVEAVLELYEEAFSPAGSGCQIV